MGRKSKVWFACGSAILIAILTLSPHYRSVGSEADRTFQSGSESAGQIVENVLLFVPLGIALALLLWDRPRLGPGGVAVVVAAASAGYSLAIESLQLFIPGRFSTIADLFANLAGGILGFAVLALAKRRWRIAVAAYAVFGFVVSVPLGRTSSFSNWDGEYHLLVGNELTGDRPWHGTVRELFIFDRALTADEVSGLRSVGEALPVLAQNLVGYYPLSSSQDLRDHSGHLPDFQWVSAPRGTEESEPAEGIRWLESVDPVSYLCTRLRERSEFTLRARIRSASTRQSGPARIVSVSANTGLRNFTLAQEASDLVFRLRTIQTGENGVDPMLTVPGVFAAGGEKDVAVTYKGGVLLVHVNGILRRERLELNAGTALCGLFRSEIRDTARCELAYRILLLVPVGFLAARSIHVPGVFLFTVPLLLEWFIAISLHRTIYWRWAAMGAAIMLGVSLLDLAVRTTRRSKGRY